MFAAILAALPIAVGMILATLPIIAIPLILLSRGEIAVLRAFLAGYVGGFLLLGSIVLLLADVIAPGTEGPARWMIWLRVVIGLGLVFLAGAKWNGRDSGEDEPAMPGWMKALDTINVPGAASLGLAVVVLNPKNALLVASGALAIASVTYAPFAQMVALVVFTAVSCVAIVSPWLLFLWKGEAAKAPLDQLKGFVARNNAAIMSIVLALIGSFVVLNAAAYL